MNFLQLCQRLRMECGVPGNGPTTVVGTQTEESQRLINWINAAWMDIQTAHQDWQWMRTTATFTTVAGQALYSPTTDILLTDFGMWARDTFRNYDTATGYGSEILMAYLDYDVWRNAYQLGNLRTTTARPTQITISPNKSIGLGPVPVSGYTILGDYYRAPSELALDADTPALPTQFHMAIVYKAMMHYGLFEASSEVYQRGEAEFNKLMRRLSADRLPEIIIAGALA